MESETPLRLFSRLAQDSPLVSFRMLSITMSISAVPATKITGLNATARKLWMLNILANHPHHDHSPQSFFLNTEISMSMGDPTMNTRRRPTLMIFATSSNISPIEKRKSIRNLIANSSVNGTTSVVVCVPRYCWNLKMPMPRKMNGPLTEL